MINNRCTVLMIKRTFIMTSNKTPVTKAFFLFFKGRKILALERMVITCSSIHVNVWAHYAIQ